MGQFLTDGGADTNVSITGGLGAFLAMFLLALAVWALGWSMTRHLRRVNYLQRQHEQQARRPAEPGRPSTDEAPQGPPRQDGGDETAPVDRPRE